MELMEKEETNVAEELTFEKPQYSEQEQIRRAKLAKYCEEGRDPYTITRLTAPILLRIS